MKGSNIIKALTKKKSNLIQVKQKLVPLEVAKNDTLIKEMKK